MRAVLTVFLFLCLTAWADEGHKHAALPGEQLGKVSFPTTCSKAAQRDFEVAVAKLHSFWYDAALEAFQGIADREPACAMANWGVAMTLYKPLWYPSPKNDVAAARAALARAAKDPAKSQRERDYIAAIATYFDNAETVSHDARAKAYAQRMAEVAAKYPKDNEARIFYALALRATATPQDKTYVVQRKVGEMLKPLFKKHPQHPGLAHYIIHTYDYAELANEGLEAARVYAKIAPAAPHALHMPSHIFTRVGLWEESAATNVNSANAAKPHAAKGSSLAQAEQLHAYDYMMYAYLQLGQLDRARDVIAQADAVAASGGMNGEYAQAAIQARWALERQDWQAAAELTVKTTSPATKAITHWARALGFARTQKLDLAREELLALEMLRDQAKDAPGYPWHLMIEIQRLQAAGWIAHAEGKNAEALSLLQEAAALEDQTDKHPVTPGAILPAREQLADLLVATGDRAAAAKQYEATLAASPNRLRSKQSLESLKQVAAR